MTSKITLEQALELVTFEHDVDGTWYVANVKGNCRTVGGNCDTVKGNCRTVGGNCDTVKGNCDTVEGFCDTVEGSCVTVQGDCGFVEGSCVTVQGDCGTVEGTCGTVKGEVFGTINGREWQYVETPKDKLKRLIEEGADKEQLLEAFNQLEDK